MAKKKKGIDFKKTAAKMQEQGFNHDEIRQQQRAIDVEILEKYFAANPPDQTTTFHDAALTLRTTALDGGPPIGLPKDWQKMSPAQVHEQSMTPEEILQRKALATNI